MLWKPEKNEWLKANRNLSFEFIVEAIAEGHLITILENKNHKNQVILVVEIEDFMIAVPTIINDKAIFFMTAYRSTSLKKKYGMEK